MKAGQVVAVLGSNGAGKTTCVRTICGMVKATSGSVIFNDKELVGQSSRFILDQGIIQVPEGRQLFTGMTVYENLEMGAYNKESQICGIRRVCLRILSKAKGTAQANCRNSVGR